MNEQFLVHGIANRFASHREANHIGHIVFIAPVAFAAFCVWLTVRIVNRRERWAKWTLAVVVGLPVLYVASFGPACWFVSWTGAGCRFVAIAYNPILRTYFHIPQRMGAVLHAWANLGVNHKAGHEACSTCTVAGEYEFDIVDPQNRAVISP